MSKSVIYCNQPVINCGLTVVVFFCFGLDLVPGSGCISLSSVGCGMGSHSSSICGGRSKSSAAGEALLESEVIARS